MILDVLEKELKEEKQNSIYLLYGEEIFLLESIVKKIKKQFGEMVPGINYIQIDETNVEELISDLETPSFGYDKKLIYKKEPVQKIVITLYNHFKKLYLVKIAIEQNLNIAEALNLKPNQMFLASKYKTQASYFQKDELQNILEEFRKLDQNSKKGLIDINIGLEAILAKYCS